MCGQSAGITVNETRCIRCLCNQKHFEKSVSGMCASVCVCAWCDVSWNISFLFGKYTNREFNVAELLRPPTVIYYSVKPFFFLLKPCGAKNYRTIRTPFERWRNGERGKIQRRGENTEIYWSGVYAGIATEKFGQ